MSARCPRSWSGARNRLAIAVGQAAELALKTVDVGRRDGIDGTADKQQLVEHRHPPPSQTICMLRRPGCHYHPSCAWTSWWRVSWNSVR
jgi:hypothetical protein